MVGVIATIVGYILPKIFEEISKHFYGISFIVIVALVIYRGERHLRKKFDK